LPAVKRQKNDVKLFSISLHICEQSKAPKNIWDTNIYPLKKIIYLQPLPLKFIGAKHHVHLYFCTGDEYFLEVSPHFAKCQEGTLHPPKEGLYPSQ